MLYLQGVIQNLHFYQYLMIATMHHTCSEPDLLTSVFTLYKIYSLMQSSFISIRSPHLTHRLQNVTHTPHFLAHKV